MANWFKGLTEKVSDIIPNEFSKLNSVSRFLPPPFSQMVQIPAAADRFSESYSNNGGLVDSGLYGASAFMGTSGDPNMNSPKNADPSGDWALMGGKLVDMIPSPNGQASMSGPNAGGMDLSKSLGSIDFGSIMDGISMPSAYAAESDMTVKKPKKINTNDVMSLASVIYGEGASTDQDTMRMIGSTVLNRLDSGKAKEFGANLNEVINKGYYAARNPNTPYKQALAQNFPDKQSQLAWKRAYQIASGLMSGTTERVPGHFYFTPKEIIGQKKAGFRFDAVKKTGEFGGYKVFGY